MCQNRIKTPSQLWAVCEDAPSITGALKGHTGVHHMILIKIPTQKRKWCICHIDIHDKTTLLEKMYLGRDNIWLSQSRSWTTNFLLEIPTDQGGLRRVKSEQQETDWCEGNMAPPTRQEVNKPELIAKRSQVFLLCQKDTFIRVLKKYYDCLEA